MAETQETEEENKEGKGKMGTKERNRDTIKKLLPCISLLLTLVFQIIIPDSGKHPQAEKHYFTYALLIGLCIWLILFIFSFTIGLVVFVIVFSIKGCNSSSD